MKIFVPLQLVIDPIIFFDLSRILCKLIQILAVPTSCSIHAVMHQPNYFWHPPYMYIYLYNPNFKPYFLTK